MTGTRRDALARWALLLSAGGFIGAVFPLGKLAVQGGVPPLAYALAVSLGSGAILTALGRSFGAGRAFDRETLTYFLIAGLLTFALPFAAIFFIIRHLGSGLPAIFQSLAPVFTVLLTLALRMERPVFRRVLGIILGAVGVQAIVGGPQAQQSASIVWYFIALLPPFALAAGNVYRTAKWPTGVAPLVASGGSLFGAAIWLAPAFALVQMFDGSPTIAPLIAAKGIIAAQIICASAGYVLFFRLQLIGGPVFLSQISYVNAGVGMAFAVLVFGETLSSAAWIGTALIFASVYFVGRTQAQSRAANDPRAS